MAKTTGAASSRTWVTNVAILVVPEARDLSFVPESREADTVLEAREADTVPEAREADTVPALSSTHPAGDDSPSVIGPGSARPTLRRHSMAPQTRVADTARSSPRSRATSSARANCSAPG